MKNKVCIVLAGGEGTRFGLTKQFIPVHNIPVFIYTLKNLANINKIIVIQERFIEMAKDIIKENNIQNYEIISSSDCRQSSIAKVLNILAERKFTGKVAITDANRPCLKLKTVDECFKILETSDAVIAVAPTVNTQCIVEKNRLKSVLSRQNMFELLMPQCFKFKRLLKAHQNTKKQNVTDDTQILLEFYPNAKIKIYPTSLWESLKLTNVEDYKIFECLLKKENHD